LVVTGANPAHHLLVDEAFWEGTVEVLDWAEKETRGILCSCLATHGVLEKNLGTLRSRLPRKRWGVYSHRLMADHPLLDGLDGVVVAPHSHWYDVTRDRFEAVGVKVLAEGEEAGVHMAVSDDDFYVFFQGHPEYETVSLLKEYKRETARFARGESETLPPFPENYFAAEVTEVLEAHRDRVTAARRSGSEPPPLDEDGLVDGAVNRWTDPGKVIFRNWLKGIAGRG
jgi:homoserine O-succinyltransferase